MEEENKAKTTEESTSSSEKMPPPPSRQEQANIERAEEEKLRAKYPKAPANKPMPPTGPVGGAPGGAAAAGGGGHSAFLQKRLAKGTKYFDSGDYNMAKQKGPRGMAGRLTIPVQGGLSQPSTGDTIPTPDTVPARKLSIIQPQHDHTRSVHVPSDPAHIGLGHHGVHTSPPGVPGQPMANPAITKLAL